MGLSFPVSKHRLSIGQFKNFFLLVRGTLTVLCPLKGGYNLSDSKEWSYLSFLNFPSQYTLLEIFKRFTWLSLVPQLLFSSVTVFHTDNINKIELPPFKPRTSSEVPLMLVKYPTALYGRLHNAQKLVITA